MRPVSGIIPAAPIGSAAFRRFFQLALPGNQAGGTMARSGAAT